MHEPLAPYLPPHRYQVTEASARALREGHPWVFRGKLSSAAKALSIPSLVRVVDGENRFVGLAVHEPLGPVGLRVISALTDPPTFEQLLTGLTKALSASGTAPGRRVLNGEADGFPGLCLDLYASCAVWQPYLAFWTPLLPALDAQLRATATITSSVFKPGRSSNPTAGDLPAEPVVFEEAGTLFHSYPLSGQKTGFYLDLLGVRAQLPSLCKGLRVLNAFAGNGSLSVVARRGGAERVTSVEVSPLAAERARVLYRANGLMLAEEDWLQGDAWALLPRLVPGYDLVILDPPQLCSKREGIPAALAAWKKLLAATASLLSPGGLVLAISCTGLVNPHLGPRFFADRLGSVELVRSGGLPPDHRTSPNFPEGDYLRWWLLKVGARRSTPREAGERGH